MENFLGSVKYMVALIICMLLFFILYNFRDMD